MKNQKTDIETIRRSLTLTTIPGQVYELRTLGKPHFGYFDDFSKMAQAAAELSGEEGIDGVYFTINPVLPVLLARTNNCVKWARRGDTTKDQEILNRVTFLVDVDSATRLSGISATEEEKTTTLAKATKIRDYLLSFGFPVPLFADSGNGYHLRFWIDLPNDTASKELIKKSLEALAARFNDTENKVDTTLHNASRICKIYGTISAKGADMLDRPHRITAILEEGSADRVSREQLQELAATLPVKLRRAKSSLQLPGQNWTPEEIEEMLDIYGIEHKGRLDYNNGFKWQLDHCVFNDSHAGTDAVLYLLPDELDNFYFTYKCSHDSCQEFKGRNPFITELRNRQPEISFNFHENGSDSTTRPHGMRNGSHGEASKTTKQTKQLIVKKFSDVIEKDAEFFWRPYIPFGELTMFSGDPGDGKSWMSLLLGSKLTNGKTLSDFGTDVVSREPGNVLIIAAEDSLQKTLKKRARVCGADQDRMMYLAGFFEEPDGSKNEVTLTEKDVSVIENAICETKARMLIIDPIACFGGDLNLNQSSQMRKVTTPLKHLAEKYNIAILIIRHNRKSDDGKRAIHKGSGSIDGTGAVRSELAFIKTEMSSVNSEHGTMIHSTDQFFAMVHVKCNLDLKGESIAYSIRQGSLQIDGISDKTEADVIQQQKQGSLRVDSWMKEELKNGPVPAKEAECKARALGFGSRCLKNAKRRLGVVSKPVGFGKVWHWQYEAQLDKSKEQSDADSDVDTCVEQGLPTQNGDYCG